MLPADLVARRAALLERSGALREQLALDARSLEQHFALADRVRDLVHRVRERPQWLLAPVALAIALKPARALSWGLRLWGAWRLWKQVMRAVAQR